MHDVAAAELLGVFERRRADYFAGFQVRQVNDNGGGANVPRKSQQPPLVGAGRSTARHYIGTGAAHVGFRVATGRRMRSVRIRGCRLRTANSRSPPGSSTVAWQANR